MRRVSGGNEVSRDALCERLVELLDKVNALAVNPHGVRFQEMFKPFSTQEWLDWFPTFLECSSEDNATVHHAGEDGVESGSLLPLLVYSFRHVFPPPLGDVIARIVSLGHRQDCLDLHLTIGRVYWFFEHLSNDNLYFYYENGSHYVCKLKQTSYNEIPDFLITFLYQQIT